MLSFCLLLILLIGNQAYGWGGYGNYGAAVMSSYNSPTYGGYAAKSRQRYTPNPYTRYYVLTSDGRRYREIYINNYTGDIRYGAIRRIR